jgi:hypothetical protein
MGTLRGLTRPLRVIMFPNGPVVEHYGHGLKSLTLTPISMIPISTPHNNSEAPVHIHMLWLGERHMDFLCLVWTRAEDPTIPAHWLRMLQACLASPCQ